jgi:hypothetical protein
MADEDRTFAPTTPGANRAQMQGLGVGAEEMDKQQAPNRDSYAASPQRTEPFDQSLEGATNGDHPTAADFTGQEPGDVQGSAAAINAGAPGAVLDDRNAAGMGQAGDLGASTPANVDIHNIGQSDNPEQEWGDELIGEGGVHSSNNTRKGIRTEAERGQGAKTRQFNKDEISRRT